jgi:hypothetical protein
MVIPNVCCLKTLLLCHFFVFSHVAGTIGGVGNNGLGVAGVCQRGVKIIPLKFLGGVGGSGTLDSAVAALDYVLTVKENYNLYLVATSNSWCATHCSKGQQHHICNEPNRCMTMWC